MSGECQCKLFRWMSSQSLRQYEISVMRLVESYYFILPPQSSGNLTRFAATTAASQPLSTIQAVVVMPSLHCSPRNCVTVPRAHPSQDCGVLTLLSPSLIDSRYRFMFSTSSSTRSTSMYTDDASWLTTTRLSGKKLKKW